MAGDWIKMRHDLRSDPAVISIAEELGVEEDLVVGKLHRFWTWADKHTIDGNAPGVTYSWLDRYLCVAGFSMAMENAGWLTHDGATLSIPRFNSHIAQSAKVRALTAKRVAAFRVTHTALAREEKRREEKIPPKSPKGDFAAFWKIVPFHKRQAKVKAEAAYLVALRKLAKREADPAGFLLDRAMAYYESPLGQTPYCNGPAPFLNQGHYDDDPAAWQRGDDKPPAPAPHESHLPFLDEVQT